MKFQAGKESLACRIPNKPRPAFLHAHHRSSNRHSAAIKRARTRPRA
jgi:hypothetical protein